MTSPVEVFTSKLTANYLVSKHVTLPFLSMTVETHNYSFGIANGISKALENFFPKLLDEGS